jgi:hypothetical protein
MAHKTGKIGECRLHGEFHMDADDSPCPACEDGLDGNGNNNCLFGIQCPKCGNAGEENRIIVVGLAEFDLTDDGTDMRPVPEFEDDAPMACGCGYKGTYDDFTKAYEKVYGEDVVEEQPTNAQKVEAWKNDPVRSHWDSYPDFPISDWRFEVANEDTLLGYHEWLECRAEMEDDE